MDEKKNLKDWISEELDNTRQTESDYEERPSLKLQEGIVTEIEVNLGLKPNEWVGEDDSGQPIKKAILPINQEENGTVIKKYWWLNKRNPIYRQILEKGKDDPNPKIKVLRTGQRKNTKYVLVK